MQPTVFWLMFQSSSIYKFKFSEYLQIKIMKLFAKKVKIKKFKI